jgi:hypothetical protein
VVLAGVVGHQRRQQAPEVGEIGAGIQLGPNAFHGFGALGVGDKARRRSVFTDDMVMHDAIDADQVGKIETGEAFRKRVGKRLVLRPFRSLVCNPKPAPMQKTFRAFMH